MHGDGSEGIMVCWLYMLQSTSPGDLLSKPLDRAGRKKKSTILYTDMRSWVAPYPLKMGLYMY